MLQLSADSVVSVTDSVVFSYDVIGSNLLGLILDYGDGQVDSIGFLGAQSAGGTVFHRYQAQGMYSVNGTAEDALQGSVSRDLTVTITP